MLISDGEPQRCGPWMVQEKEKKKKNKQEVSMTCHWGFSEPKAPPIGSALTVVLETRK